MVERQRIETCAIIPQQISFFVFLLSQKLKDFDPKQIENCTMECKFVFDCQGRKQLKSFCDVFSEFIVPNVHDNGSRFRYVRREKKTKSYKEAYKKAL